RDRGGAAREDDAAWREVADAVVARCVRPDLAIDAVLAHPPRDQLGDLAAEIEDQDLVDRLRGHLSGSGSAARPPSPSQSLSRSGPSLSPLKGGGGEVDAAASPSPPSGAERVEV